MKKFIIILFLAILIILAFFYKFNNEENNEMIKYENQVKSSNNESNNTTNENNFSGKTIAFIGDSLVEGYGNNYHGFDYYLSQNLQDTKFVNNSKSGSTITSNSGTDNIIMINQVRSLECDPDVIVFDGGANDIIGYSMGFLNKDLQKDIYSENTDDDTVMKDLENIISELENKFPKAKLCYFNPFLIDDDTVSHLVENEDLINEIKNRRDIFFGNIENVLKKYNVEYFDLSSLLENSELKYRNEDYIHLNEDGYKMLTPQLLNKLQKVNLSNVENVKKDCDLLIIGNSLTVERSGIGMAATDQYHDYYYLLGQKLKDYYENLHMSRISAIKWEENRVISSRTDWINENLKPDKINNKDIVIFQLGDNCVPTEEFESSVTELVNYVKNYSPNAKMYLVGMWFINEERLAMMPQISQKLNMTFIDISDLVVDENKSEIGTEVIGIDGQKDRINTIEEAFHPNNQGMELIAQRIFDKLEK